MKDPTDNKTADMHQPAPKKRGPKPTGKALTPAERKAKQRERDRTRLLGSDAEQDGKPVTVTGLIEAIANAAHLRRADDVERLAQELAQRIRAASDEPV